MKSILMSCSPKECCNILNYIQSILVRKKFPKDFKGWVYIYCTKEDSLIKLQERYKDRYTCEQEFKCDDFPKMYSGYEGKGKVVARFYCDRLDINHILPSERIMAFNRNVEPKLKDICLTKEELMSYGNGDDYYAHLIYISQLEIFDKPKELSEFKQEWYDCGNNFHSKPLTKAPKSYMFIEAEE